MHPDLRLRPTGQPGRGRRDGGGLRRVSGVFIGDADLTRVAEWPVVKSLGVFRGW